MNISAIILANNEEKNIQAALESVSFCSEIIVVDDHSTDKTIEIAKKYGAHIVNLPVSQDFAKARNTAMEKAKSDWVLFLDADERVTPELRAAILKELSKTTDVSAYALRRQDWFWGRAVSHGEVMEACRNGIIRLVKKGDGKWRGKVHEVWITEQKTKTISGFLLHYSHQSLSEFISEVNKYSTIRAKELQEKGKSFSLFQLVAYPPLKFFYTFFLLAGFLDGAAGFAYSFLMAFHSFLVRAKLYQYTKIDNA